MAIAVECDTDRLQVLDPNLPFLASRAAIELDVFSRGGQTDMSAVRSLAECLRKSVAAAAGTLSLMDPATASVVGSSLSSEPVNTMDELARIAKADADKLVSVAQGGASHISWAKAFCVALSTNAIAYRNAISDIASAHPFRR